MPATYDVRIDWSGDGDFTDVGENITARVLDQRTPIVAQYGRDQIRALSPIGPGRAELEVNNASREFSPENASSPLAGSLLPGRQLRIQGTLSDTTYTVFRGHLDDYEVLPDTDMRSIRLTAFDVLAKFKEATITVDLHHSVSTGQAIGLILDALGWPTADRDIDQGATWIRWYWEERTDGLTALQRLVNSEGPGAFVFVDADNRFVFRDRHHRLTRAASLTAQATFRGSGAEPVMSRGLVYDHGWRDIVNSVEIPVADRQPASALSDVFTSNSTYTLSDGETIQLHAGASDPFYGAVVPESGTDITVASGTITATLSRTAGQSTIVRLTASGGPAVVTGLKIRAYPVSVTRTVTVSDENSTSISRYGRRSLLTASEMPWVGVWDARAIAAMVLAQRAERLPIVRIRVQNANDTRLLQQLSRDLSDRIRIVDTETGLDDEFYIERIEHRITEGGLSHETVFGCEKVVVQPADVFILGSATRGVLGTNRLAADGLDDPANVFVLGSGVLGTNLLAH